ncbi:CYTH domain-containing protein [Synechococcus sp. CCY 9618]|uniref:CYTH domain-containing protein n=1 Tax=Synechococcus sp. CCY 9618 TaxID=2815602 RepID=UPI001C239B50|nr:CYTH domain-containing protein [Synechococcus sp. CCY 9618]
MALEIERRFLVRGVQWRGHVLRQTTIRQGYLVTEAQGLTLRVRLARPLQGAETATLTLKAPVPRQQAAAAAAPAGQPLARLEFEYPIPTADGEDLLALGDHRLIKTRYDLDLAGGDWVLDVFGGVNAPLVVAEVELDRVDCPVHPPVWCVQDITGRRDLSNAALARRPLSDWPEEARQALLAEVS